MRIRINALLAGILVSASLTACSQLAITSAPEVEFQDASLSLATVNPEDHLHHFDYDRNLHLDIQEVRSWRRFNVTVTELSFASPRGGRVPTLLFEPDGEAPFAGLLLMHGAPGQKENFTDLGVHYARYGFVAVAIDAPQFRSEHNIGHVSMALIWPRFEELDLEEQSQLIVDLQRAVDLLLTRETVDPERLTYIGGSYGGAMGGLFAGVETRLKAYVLKVGDGGIIEHLSEPDERGYPLHLKRWVDILWPIEPLHFVGRAAPAELLFQNGVTDSYVPSSDTLRYHQAASEPKTILWYNAGHFLPPRHYYDHLIWQHQRIGVDTILLKPFFCRSGLIYDRLLMLWFGLSALSVLFGAWLLGMRSRAGGGAILAWLLVILFLGPAGLVAYLLLKRDAHSLQGPSAAARTLSASLWMITVTMIGFTVVTQVNFVTVFDSSVQGLLFLIVPQFAAGIGLLLRHLLGGSVLEGRTQRASVLLSYLSSSTMVTAGAFLFVTFLGRVMLHFAFPVYHPLSWFVIMLGSMLLVLVAYPLHLWLGKWGLPIWEMPGLLPEARLEERPALQWYRALGMVAGSYLLLFIVQASYVATFTPIYISFLDAIKLMIGMDVA